MGRTKEKNIRIFYTYDEKTKSQTCLKCQKIINNDHTSNMVRHLKLHKMDYTNYLLTQKDNSNKIKKKENCESVNVKLNKDKILMACVDMVACGNCSFNFLNSRGFQEIITAITKPLNFTINSENIKKEMTIKAAILKQEIIEELKNKIFSLKIDEATRLNRSILGINLQYISNNEIKIITLDAIELFQSQKAEYLKNEVIKVLEEFGLDLRQVYSITSDNGRNMLKAAKLLNDELLKENVDYELDSETNIDTENNLDYDSNCEYDSDSEITIIVDDEDDFDDDGDANDSIINKTEAEIIKENNSTNKYMIYGVKCAVHTIQLAVSDAAKKNRTAENIKI